MEIPCFNYFSPPLFEQSHQDKSKTNNALQPLVHPSNMPKMQSILAPFSSLYNRCFSSRNNRRTVRHYDISNKATVKIVSHLNCPGWIYLIAAFCFFFVLFFVPLVWIMMPTTHNPITWTNVPCGVHNVTIVKDYVEYHAHIYVVYPFDSQKDSPMKPSDYFSSKEMDAGEKKLAWFSVCGNSVTREKIQQCVNAKYKQNQNLTCTYNRIGSAQVRDLAQVDTSGLVFARILYASIGLGFAIPLFCLLGIWEAMMCDRHGVDQQEEADGAEEQGVGSSFVKTSLRQMVHYLCYGRSLVAKKSYTVQLRGEDNSATTTHVEEVSSRYQRLLHEHLDEGESLEWHYHPSLSVLITRQKEVWIAVLVLFCLLSGLFFVIVPVWIVMHMDQMLWNILVLWVFVCCSFASVIFSLLLPSLTTEYVITNKRLVKLYQTPFSKSAKMLYLHHATNVEVAREKNAYDVGTITWAREYSRWGYVPVQFSNVESLDHVLNLIGEERISEIEIGGTLEHASYMGEV